MTGTASVPVIVLLMSYLVNKSAPEDVPRA